MTTVRSALLVALLLAAGSASAAGEFCPTGGPVPKCSNLNIGDPVFGPDLTTMYEALDAQLSTGTGTLDFRRMYVSSDLTWRQATPVGNIFTLTARLPKPFGSTAGGASLRWWSNYFSFAAEMPGSAASTRPDCPKVVVRDTAGVQTEFVSPTNCTSLTEFELMPSPSNPSAPHRLFKTGRPAGYVLRRDDGTSAYYQDLYDVGNLTGTPRWFMLTRAVGPGGQELFRLSYRVPLKGQANCLQPPANSGSSQGAPYIFRVLAPGGLGFELDYVAGKALGGGVVECPIAAVRAIATNSLFIQAQAPAQRRYPEMPGQAPEPPVNGPATASALAASYTFASSGGLLASATGPNIQEAYEYSKLVGGLSVPAFVRKRGNSEVAAHLYAGAKVKEATGEGQSFAFFTGDYSCAPGSDCVACNPNPSIDRGVWCVACNPESQCCAHPAPRPPAPPIRRQAIATAGTGDGRGGAAQLVQHFDYARDFDFGRHGARLYRTTDACSQSPDACSPGTVTYEHRAAPAAGAPPPPECGAAAPGYLHAVKDKLGHFTVTPNVAVSVGALSRKRLEQRQTLRGATVADGKDALERESHTYFYDSLGVQHPEQTLRDSLLKAGASTVVGKKYDGNGRVTEEYTEGYLLARDGSVEASPRLVKTFYRLARVCEPSGNDRHGRTLRVEGPCEVDPLNAGACKGLHPVTEFTYYDDGAAGAKAGRLKKVARYTSYVSGNCGPSLAEEYLDYTVEGDPLQVKDANGVVTVFEYQARNVTKKTVAGREWLYRHADGKLVEVTFPEGNKELFCYRKDTPGAACTGGTFTGRLEWKAKTATSDGSTWSEKSTYAYRAEDGALLEEVRRDACLSGCSPTSGEVRSVRRYDLDLHGRPTFEAAGKSGTPWAQAPRAFDAANNPVGLGHAFNGPPAFCKAGDELSLLCAHLGYDAANRLVALKEYPAGEARPEVATRLAYDAHGNVCAVTSGASEDWALASECKVAGDDDARTAYYRHDDFGRVVEARLPNLTEGAARGVVRFAFDAQGNLLFRQTPELRANGLWLSFEHDRLGRLLAMMAESTGSILQLFTTRYDDAGPLPPGCPALSHTAGRPARVEDATGTTLLSYDAEGRLLLEAHLRPGAAGCATSHSEGAPHTEYTYTPNGNLASIVYPHGRTVAYSYSADLARRDRVEKVLVSMREGGAWVLRELVREVAWEPYGGLRGYAGVDLGSGLSLVSVNYLLGDDGSVPKANPCSVAALPSTGSGSDATGRLRALFVSRGTGPGNVFRRWYTHRGDMVTQTQTCLLGNGPIVETFGYDGALRVTSAASSPAAAVDSTTFQWDARGNPLARGINAAGARYVFTKAASPLRPDAVASVSADLAGTQLSLAYGFDADGRTRTIRWPVDSTGEPNDELELFYGLGQENGALDSAFRAAARRQVAYFNYYFDAQGRRRLKVYPSGAADEFFYDNGRQLLEDRGVAQSFGQPFDDIPLDEYVWLGARPVALLRGGFAFDLFSREYVRKDDGPGDCARNDEPASCGVYFPVTDDIGKPVLLLDSQARIAGTGEYDVFGQVNRRQAWGESPHPYPQNYSAQAPSVAVAPVGLQLDMRVQFHTLDTEACPGGPFYDPLYLVNTLTSAQVGPYGGHHKGATWTDWLSATSGGAVHVAFTSDGQSRPPDANGCPAGASSNFPYQGYSVRQAEFRRYEAGATPAWLPLRFPGQYHDHETDLAENWHRNYDSFLGRYLQPEPMLQEPGFARGMARHGLQTPAYAYALNNPIAYVDPTGKNPAAGLLPVIPALPLAAAATLIVYCKANPQACIDILRDSPLNPNRWPPLLPPMPRPPSPGPAPTPGDGPMCKVGPVPFPEFPSKKNCEKYWVDVFEDCVSKRPADIGCVAVADAAYEACMKKVN